MTPEQINTVIGIGLLIGAIVGGIWRAMHGMNTQNDARKSEISQLQNDLDTERRAAREQRQKVDELQRQLDGNQALLREVDRTNANLTGRLTEQREIYSKQLTDQSNDIAFLRQTINERDTQIVGLNTHIVGLNKTVEDFKTAQRTNDQRHTEDAATIEKLRGDLEKATEDVVKLTRRVDELKAQVDEMQQELSRRDIELADKDRQISELTTRAETAERLVTDLQAQLAAAIPPLTTITSADPIVTEVTG